MVCSSYWQLRCESEGAARSDTTAASLFCRGCGLVFTACIDELTLLEHVPVQKLCLPAFRLENQRKSRQLDQSVTTLDRRTRVDGLRPLGELPKKGIMLITFRHSTCSLCSVRLSVFHVCHGLFFLLQSDVTSPSNHCKQRLPQHKPLLFAFDSVLPSIVRLA